MACLIGAGVVGIACYFFPPLRIVPLDEARARRAQETFQARSELQTYQQNAGNFDEVLQNATLGFYLENSDTLGLEAGIDNVQVRKTVEPAVGIQHRVLWIHPESGCS